MEFNERLDKIWERISDEDFLANGGEPTRFVIMSLIMSRAMNLLSETR